MDAKADSLSSLRAVKRPLPLRVEIANSIKELIVRGDLQCDRHLVETELAASLGVSRLPVREALQLLARDGWIDLRVGYGAYVHTPTAKEIDEVFSVRTALEGEAAAQAARRVRDGLISEEDLDRLHRALTEGAKEATKGKNVEIVDHNAILHSLIIQLSGNTVLEEMAAVIEGRVRWYFGAIAVRRAPASWEEHGLVVAAVTSGSIDAARQLMSEHCERSREGLLNLPK